MLKRHICIASLLGLALIASLLAQHAQAETLQDAVQAAMRNNPQLQAQRQQSDIAEEYLEQARAKRRPTAALSGSVGYESVDSTSPFPFGFGDRPIASAQFETALPIYMGGRLQAGVRQAKAGIGVAGAQLDAIHQDIILQVVTSYVDVLRDRETITIRENSVALLAQQVRAATDRFEVGEVTRTDVAQSQARLAGAHAARAGAEAQLQSSMAGYAFLVGAMPDQLVPVPPAPALPQTVEAAWDIALNDSPDIRALRFNERAAKEAVALAAGELKPTVSIVGAAAVQETFDNNYRDTSISATAVARVPLYQGGQLRSQVRSAKSQRAQARFLLENTERQVRARIAQSWYANIAAIRAIEASSQQVDAAQIAYQGAQAELSVGVRTTLDVLDQEQQLLEAQLNLIEARRDAYVAAHQLLRATGQLNLDSLGAALP